MAVVTLQTFYRGKLDLLTVYLRKIEFLSVTDARLRACLKGERVTLVLGLP